MDTEFTELQVENFGPFIGKHTLPLGTNGVTFIKGQNKVEPRLGANGCLAGETLIDCPRDLAKYPAGIAIKNLVGKSFLTYSWDVAADTLVLSQVNNVWCSGLKRIYKVKLSAYPDGKNKIGSRSGGHNKSRYMPPLELVGTYDHPVMLCDGTWIKLGQLRPGHALKSLYRSAQDRGKLRWSNNVQCITHVGKQKLRNPIRYYGLSTSIREQQFVCSTVNGPRPKDSEVHHKNHNSLDHTPSNLTWVRKGLHQAYHTSIRNRDGTAGWRVNGEHPRGMLGKKHAQATRKRISASLVKSHARGEGRWGKPANHKVVSLPVYVGVQPVYDMEVVRTHNFVANGVFVHNSGKTKLLNALPWCLYGRTADDLTSTDIRPWKGKGRTRVRVKLITWSGDEGIRHTIERTTNPNTFTLNGKPCSVDEIEKLVGWSLPVFRQAVFLGQGQPLFYDLPNREKLEFLVDVLKLARWDKYSERAARLTAELEIKLAQVVGLLSANTVRVEELANQVKLQQEEVNNWESWRAERLEETEKQVRALAKRVDKLETAHADVSSKFDWAGAELKLLLAEEVQHAKKAAEAETTYRAAKSAQIAAKQSHDEAKAELAALVKNKRCPTCGGKIERESTYLANKQRIEEAIARFSKEAHGGAVAQAERSLADLRTKAEQWAVQAETLRAEAAALEAQESLARRNLGEVQLELKGAKRQLAEFEAGANPHRDRLADLRKAHKAAIADGKSMEEQRTQLEAEAQGTKYWVKGFKDVRLFILEDVLDELEFATNSMLDTMGLVGWEVRYNVERETKSGTTQRGLIITVLNPDKATEAKWKSWSGGEGQRLRLAGALALSQVLLGRAGVECNLEVLDEPTRHLSDEGVEDLCEFLAERAEATGKAIHLVDHKAIESARFARTVIVVKDNEGSRVVI